MPKLFSRRFRTGLCSGLVLFALGLRLLLTPGAAAWTQGQLRQLAASALPDALCLFLERGVRLDAEAETFAFSGPAAAPSGSAETSSSDGAEAAPSATDGADTETAAAPSLPASNPASASDAPQDGPAFRAEEADAIEVRGSCDYRIDKQALLLAPLRWRVQGGAPTVLILHTHTCEAYTPTDDAPYEASADYRTLDERQNMLAVGDALTEALTARGVSVLHDRSVYDYPNYNDSYANAKQALEKTLREQPSIVMVLDLHRDAAEPPVREAVTLDGEDCARLMLVVGTDQGGLYHPYWQENLSCALKLQALLERQSPGLCRPLNLREERFNGQCSTGAMIVEVGSTGNTMAEALRAMPRLADAVAALLEAQSG